MPTKPSRHEAPRSSPSRMWSDYASAGFWDEMVDERGGPRPGCEGVLRYLWALGDDILERQRAADLAIRAMGITFTVYEEATNIDRPWPFDIIPRVICTTEW